MASYHFWHPTFVETEPLTLEVFITQGDALFPPAGDDRTAVAIMKALGTESVVAEIEFHVVRTAYFSSYREDTTDWRDAWSLAWVLRVMLDTDRVPTIPMPPAYGYFGFDGASSLPVPEADSWPCMLIADASNSKILNVAHHIIKKFHPDAQIRLGKSFGRYQQIRCDIGERTRAWYETGASEAEATLVALFRAGAMVHFEGLGADD